MYFTIWAAVVSGIAYLTHDLAVLYIGTSAFMLLCHKRFRELFIFAPLSLVFALPWLFISNVLYHRGSTFIYYPIETRGIPQPNQGKEIIDHFLHLSPIHFIKIKFTNFFYLFSPYQLLTSEGGQDIPRRIWGLSLFSVPGSVGLGLLVPLILGAFKKLRDLDLWIFILGPVVLSLIIIGWPKGLGSMHFAEAVIPLLVGLAVFYLLKLKNKLWLFIALVINILQLLFFVAFSFKYAFRGWFNIRDLLLLGLWTVILMGIVYAVYEFTIAKRSQLAQKLGV